MLSARLWIFDDWSVVSFRAAIDRIFDRADISIFRGPSSRGCKRLATNRQVLPFPRINELLAMQLYGDLRKRPGYKPLRGIIGSDNLDPFKGWF